MSSVVVMDFIFFFKQKTAYEMRISDWSSDVCSSDLPRPEAGQQLVGAADVAAQLRKAGRHDLGLDLEPSALLARRQRGDIGQRALELRLGGFQVDRKSVV